MKNIILSILISFSFCSCTSEFNSLEQAKNEVNTEGYRDGRWVDYYDSSGGLVEVLSKGYNYPLVFYKNIFNQTKGYKIENINDIELLNFKGYLLILNEQLPAFNKHNLQYKIILNDPFYSFIEL